MILASIFIIVVTVVTLTACAGMAIVEELVPVLLGMFGLIAFIILVIVIYKASTKGDNKKE